MAVVYHWKHGWIPLDHVAALSKAKGNHTLAAKMLSDVHGANGIQSRQHVAHAIRDLPSLHHEADRRDAMTQIQHGALEHASTDLIPATTQVGITQAGFLGHGLNTRGTARQSHGGFTESQRVLSQQTNFKKPGQPREWVPGHIEKIAPHDDGTADITIRHDDGTVQVERIGKRGGGGQIKAMPAGAERGSSADNRSVTAQQRAAELAAQARAKRVDSNPNQRDPGATSRPDTPSADEMQRAQAKADQTTADTMSKISDENLRANIAKYRATAPGSPTLKILEAEAHRRGLTTVTAPGSWTTHQMPDGSIQIRSKNGVELGRVRQVKAGRHKGQWEAKAEGRHGADYGDSPEKVIDALYDSFHGKSGQAAMDRNGGSPEEKRLAAYRAAIRAHQAKG